VRKLAILCCFVALCGCSKGPTKSTASRKPKPRATTSTGAGATTDAPGPLHFNIEGMDANGTKPPSDEVIASVRKTLDGYLAQAVVAPLKSGQPAGDLSTLFTADALAQLGDPSTRATLVDEGLPAASTSISATNAHATLASIAGPDEVTALMGARIDLTIHAVGPRVNINIVRQGEIVLTLVPDANSWRIDSFGVRTERNSV
jgi:hypothetical protein